MRFGLIRWQYILIYALSGAYAPYWPVYFRDELHLTDQQIGWVSAAHGVMMAIMPLLFTHWADRNANNRLLLTVCNTMAAVALAGICTTTGGFIAALTINTLFAVFSTPMSGLLGGLTFAAIHEAQQKGEKHPPYHVLRMWGSIGYTVPGFVLLIWMHFFKGTAWHGIAAAAGISLVAALSGLALPKPKRVEAAQGVPSLQAWRAMWRPPVSSAMGPIMLMFVALWIYFCFYTLYLRKLGVEDKWFGVYTNVGVAVEIFCMLGSGWFIHTLGLRRTLLLGAACTVVRFILLAAFPSEWTFLGQQLLHGPVVMSIYVIAPMYLNHKAGDSNRSSMQGLYGVLAFGVARFAGSLTGGYISDKAGLEECFWFAAILSTMALFAMIVSFYDDEAEAELKRITPTPVDEPAPDA